MSFLVFSNFVLAAFLLAMVKRSRFVSCLLLAFSTYQNFYPAMLLFPLCATFCLRKDISAKEAVLKVSIERKCPKFDSFLFLSCVAVGLLAELVFCPGSF